MIELFVVLIGIGFLIAYLIFYFFENEQLKNEIYQLKSKIEKMEVIQKKPFFKSKDFNVYSEICDLKSRAETLGFCCQCPLYQDKAREDMQQTSQAEQE